MPLDIFYGIPGDSGMTPTRTYLTTFATPCCSGFDPDLAVWSFDASKWWDIGTEWFMFGAYSSGIAEIVETPVPSVNPLNYDPATQIYSMDASKFWNAANWFTFGAY